MVGPVLMFQLFQSLLQQPENVANINSLTLMDSAIIVWQEQEQQLMDCHVSGIGVRGYFWNPFKTIQMTT